MATDVAVIKSADEAHNALRKALVTEAKSRLELAGKVYAAYEAEAWLHDNGDHQARYRKLMKERGFTSVFEAYAFDEFTLKPAEVDRMKHAGHLLAASGEREVTRFSEGALRPLAKANIIDTTGTEVLSAVLADAKVFASDEAANNGRNNKADVTSAKVSTANVRAAMKKNGVDTPAVELSKAQVKAKALAERARNIDKASKALTALKDDAEALDELRHLIAQLLGEEAAPEPEPDEEEPEPAAVDSNAPLTPSGMF